MLCINRLLVFNRFVIFNGFTIVTHLQMSLEIKIITTNTYAYSKHFLSVMIFVDFRTFAGRVTHIYSVPLAI